MCLATVYLETKGQKEEVMSDVAWVEPTSSGLRLVSLLGESRSLRATIASIDLLHSSIIVRSGAADLPQGVSPDLSVQAETGPV